MNKKILMSLGLVAVTGVTVAVLGTRAFFTDTETSTGNTFTAGEIDLKVDSQQHYNNAICVFDGEKNSLVWQLEQGQQATVPQYPVIGSLCEGNWQLTDLGPTSPKFFKFNDVKPGDSGENTISLHVYDNDAWLCAEVSNLTSTDNGITEPEGPVDNDVNSGELDDTMVWTIWRDDGNNVLETGETVLVTGKPVNGVLPVYDSTTGPALTGDSTTYLGVKWELPSATGNEVQTDMLTGDISFRVEQARNNTGFRCVPPKPTRFFSKVQNYSSTGWGGNSCPSTHPNVVGAGVSKTNSDPVVPADFPVSFVLAKTGATLDGFTYPVFPHYTYPGGEQGVAVHNGGTGQSLYVYVDCLPN